jgi:hypothetical protein
MHNTHSPQNNKHGILYQLGVITKALGDSLGWLDWLTQNKFAWSCVIIISGLISLWIGKTYSAQNCPALRDLLINTAVPIAVIIALGYVYRTKKIAIDYVKKVVSVSLVLLVPVVLTALLYPTLTNWGVTKEPISRQFCPPCLRNIEEANKLREEADRQLKSYHVQDAEKSAYAAENPYARQAVKDNCQDAKYVLARVLEMQADIFKTNGKKQEGIEKRKEALGFARDCLKDGDCPPDFVGRLQTQLTLDAKDAVELSTVNQAIPRGDSTKLRWFAEGAVSASLDGQTVDLRGERNISPTQTTDYTLQVKFSDGTTKTLNTRVIVYWFSVNPSIVPLGGASTITWSAEGANRIILDEQLVGVQGSKTVTHTKTTEHLLRIIFPDNSQTDIVSKVRVYSFSATPGYVRPGEPSSLSWSADGAQQVVVDGQSVELQGTIIVTPTQTTSYNMRVIYPSGSDKSVTATVNVIPYLFKATPQFVGPGESSKIEWVCPEPLECIWSGQKISTRGSRVLQPAKTTTETLQIKFPDGSSKSLVATITVGQGECTPSAYAAQGYDQITPILLQRSVSLSPSIRIPNIFAQPESSITLTGDEIICLAASPDGKENLKVDDQIDFSVTPRAKAWVHNFYDPATKGITTSPPQNVTWMFTPGVNRLKLLLTDTVQGSFYSTDIWLVVWRR